MKTTTRWLAILALAWPAVALPPPTPPFEIPRLVPAVAARPPLIDGTLDDDCWLTANHIEGFWFAQENRPETERTEVWLCVDNDFIYAAFYAHDRQPETILAQQTQRGGTLDRDDYVAFHIDPSRRMVEHYSFRVSANGTQHDTIPNSGSGNIAWAGDWSAGARRVVDGYTVEIAVPLTTLRYPVGQREFGIGFGRNLEREEEGSIWPAMADRFEDEYMAVYGPLTLKPVRRRPLLLPYALFRIDDDGFGFQPGLDSRYLSANDLTTLVTVNPDFRNIEDVVETIAFSDTPRLLGETRPFFREGTRFYPGSTALNTREIPDVNTAWKSFGELGRHQFGTLAVLSDRHRVDTAFDYTYRFTPDIVLGSGLVYTDDGGTITDSYPTNAVSSTHFDSYHAFGGRTLSYGGDFYHSLTNGPLGDGNAWNCSISTSGEGRLGASASYTFIDPTFHAQVGYVPEPDQRGWSLGLSGTKRSQDNFIQQHSWDVSHAQRGKSTGALLISSYGGGGTVRFYNGTSATARLYSAHRPPNRDQTVTGNYRWGLETLYEEGGVEAVYGQRGGAHYLFLHADQGWAPLPALRFNFVGEYTRRRWFDQSRGAENRTQAIVTATYELSPYSNVSLRFIEREGRLNLFLAYRNAPTSGRAWYLFFGDPNTERTELRLQAKFSWPL
ncbi:MAG: hypothetical protein HUU35_13095 [Armatimonadetes bacterium]|nr:hypothetical protein [Armatimonadota bacterium]